MQKTNESTVPPTKECPFSMEEKTAYWKKKWLREHIAYMVLMALVPLAALVVACLYYGFGLMGAYPLVLIIVYAIARNRMLAYVEGKVFSV